MPRRASVRRPSSQCVKFSLQSAHQNYFFKMENVSDCDAFDRFLSSSSSLVRYAAYLIEPLDDGTYLIDGYVFLKHAVRPSHLRARMNVKTSVKAATIRDFVGSPFHWRKGVKTFGEELDWSLPFSDGGVQTTDSIKVPTPTVVTLNPDAKPSVELFPYVLKPSVKKVPKDILIHKVQ